MSANAKPYGLIAEFENTSSVLHAAESVNEDLSMYTFENTCRIQIDALAGGGELTQVDPRILAAMAEVMKNATAGMGAMLAWPALLRKLDRSDPSYKT